MFCKIVPLSIATLLFTTNVSAQTERVLYCVWEAQRSSKNPNWESVFLGKDNPGRVVIKGGTVSYGSNKIFVNPTDLPPVNRNGAKVFQYIGKEKSALSISYAPNGQILISLSMTNENGTEMLINLAGSCTPV